jgi:hypothetical protein
MSHALCQQIDSDIAEVERLMTELRFAIAAGKSAGEDTSERERRVQELLKGWMLLQDQRQKAAEAEVASKVSARAEPQAPAPDPG